LHYTLSLLVAMAGCCGLLLWFVAVVGCCGWLLWFVAVVGCCGWWLWLVAVVGGWWLVAGGCGCHDLPSSVL
jgi:hypothetical protein